MLSNTQAGRAFMACAPRNNVPIPDLNSFPSLIDVRRGPDRLRPSVGRRAGFCGSRLSALGLRAGKQERGCRSAERNQSSARGAFESRKPVLRRMRRTFLGETERHSATLEIFLSSRNQTLGITISANSSVIC